MKCPNCSGKLEKFNSQLGAYLICDTCFGHYFSEKNIKKMHKSGYWELLISKSTELKNKRQIPCLKCQQTMSLVEINHKEQSVQIDLCKKCRILWLDKNEIEELQPISCDLESALNKEIILKEIDHLNMEKISKAILAEITLDEAMKSVRLRKKDLISREAVNQQNSKYRTIDPMDFFDVFF